MTLTEYVFVIVLSLVFFNISADCVYGHVRTYVIVVHEMTIFYLRIMYSLINRYKNIIIKHVVLPCV